MPHESTVKHDDRSVMNDSYGDRSRSLSTAGPLLSSGGSVSPLVSSKVITGNTLSAINDDETDDAFDTTLMNTASKNVENIIETNGLAPIGTTEQEKLIRISTPTKSTFVHEEQEV